MIPGQGLDKITSLDGDGLKRMFSAGTRCLELHRDAINGLNVFPVPDGDTGTNMLLTMRSVNEGSAKVSDSSAGVVMSAMAHGALLGARGNSGVILSQFLEGLAKGFDGRSQLNAQDLGKGLQLAAAAAYKAVGRPVEGTMLTVIREISLAAQESIDAGCQDLGTLMQAVVEASKLAVSRTPLQLSVLREAGVVDSGGQGIAILLEGALRELIGEDVEEAHIELCSPSQEQPMAMPQIQEEYLAATEEQLYGYCVQFLIHGHGLMVDEMRQKLSTMADSTVVVGDDQLVKVHVHSFDQEPLISYASSQGTLSQVHIDNIDEQHQEFLAIHRSQRVTHDVAIVGVVWGEGFARLFEELGCKGLVTGGQTMNPSTKELLDAATTTGASEVIILPNNSNILPAAHQATSMTELNAHVVPSTSLPQGIAALLAFNSEESFEQNLDAMNRALGTVKSIEITRAVRAASVGGLNVKEGHLMGLMDGEVAAVGESLHRVLVKTLQKGRASAGNLLTLYWGSEVQEKQARRSAAELQKSIPGLEVEVVEGGQPYYDYLASLE